MNIADKIGVYLLLSIVFTLLGGIAGQVLPGTYATEIIIFSLATIGICILVGAVWELIITCIEIVSDIFYKRYDSKFINILRSGQMTVYSVFYVSLYPIVGCYIYEEGGLIYTEATNLMTELYDPLGNVFSFAIVAFIVLVTIGTFATYLKKDNK